jgi:hypothetical protein
MAFVLSQWFMVKSCPVCRQFIAQGGIMGRGLFGVVLVLFVGLLGACGGGGGSSSNNTSGNTGTAPVVINGVAATGLPVALAQVTLTDASGTVKTGTTDASGNYSIAVGGMTFPMLAKVTYTTASGSVTVLYSYAKAAGTVNVNPLTSAAVVASSGNFSGSFDATAQSAIASHFDDKVAQLQTLLAQFGAGSANPVTGQYTLGSGLDSVFDILNLSVDSVTGILTVKTKYNGTTVATGAIGSMTIPASAVPVVDNTQVAIGTLSANSGEVGSHVTIPVTGITSTTKAHVLIGGVWVPFNNTVGLTALDAWMPPGCTGGKVAVLLDNGQGHTVMGTTAQTFIVTTQHDYAIGNLLMTNNSIGLSGEFPATGSVNVKFAQGATSVTVASTSYYNGLLVTIPASLKVLNPFTVEVTSTDGTKTSNVYA